MNIKRMRWIAIIWVVVLVLLASGCGAGSAPASTPAQAATPIPTKTPSPSATATPLAGSLNAVKIESVALAKNLIGEGTERTIFVYLPPDYNTSTKRYPVVYFLPGFGDQSMVATGQEISQSVLGGAIQGMIIVVAPGGNRLGGSFYVNSPVTGNWEDFVVQEVVGYVDSHYRTIARVESRGLGGHSMGGFGALNIAMLHPDVFGAVYSLSPGLFDEKGLANSQMFNLEYSIHKFLDGQTAVLAQPEALQPEAALSMQDYFSSAYGLAFAPDPQKPPFYFDYPYSESNGQLVRDDAVWKRWESGYGNMHDKVTQYKDNLLRLRGIVIDYGTHDQYAWIPQGCVYFDQQLTAAGIPHEMAVHDGDHQSQLGKRVLEHMLPFFSKLLAGE